MVHLSQYLRRTAALAGALIKAAAPLLLTGCLENDIPYPVVECRIEAITAEGLSGEAVIDAAQNRITLPLLETTDIRNVNITAVTLTDKAVSSVELVGYHDLTFPLTVKLSLYAEYEWTITAEQTISRHFTVDGQVGATEWDLSQSPRIARVNVGYNGNDEFDPSKGPSAVIVRSLKLGPEGITKMEIPAEEIDDFDLRNPEQPWDFTTNRRVHVTCHGRTELWDLYVKYTDLKVEFRRIDGWARTAWFYGEGRTGTKLGFRYRPAGSTEWTEVDDADITVDGGSFSANVRGLTPQTDYEAVAYSDDDDSAVLTFTTEAELPLPNGDFEIWSKIGNLICPYLSPETMFWDTGNKGATTLGADYNITTYVNNDLRPQTEGSTAARLASRYVVLKFAAGNIFTGEYAKTEGTNGRVNFGRRFTSHPTALHGWVKFSNGKINRISGHPQGRTLTTEDFDEGQIYIALGTWTADKYGGSAESPVQVYSADEKTFFNPKADDVIGYGEKIYTSPTNGWEEFTIPVEYKSTDLNPTHIIIVCSASRWGDYFTGCDQNVMLLDDLELLWE